MPWDQMIKDILFQVCPFVCLSVCLFLNFNLLCKFSAIHASVHVYYTYSIGQALFKCHQSWPCCNLGPVTSDNFAKGLVFHKHIIFFFLTMNQLKWVYYITVKIQCSIPVIKMHSTILVWLTHSLKCNNWPTLQQVSKDKGERTHTMIDQSYFLSDTTFLYVL